MASQPETTIYRATAEAWLGQLLLPVIFFALLTATAIQAVALSLWLGGAGMGIVALVALLDYLLPMARNFLVVDHRSIEGSFNGRAFRVYWTEILAAWIFDRGRRRFLCLGTRGGTLVLPLRFLDDRAIWEHVKRSAPPSALKEGAVEKLPDFRAWEAARSQSLEDAAPATVADHWLIQVIGWAGMSFFLFGAQSALAGEQYIEAAMYGGLFAASAAMVTRWGITHVDDCKVERFSFFGVSRMDWEQVRRIDIDPFDSVIVLEGEDCRLVIPGPGVWAGPNRKSALAMLLTQAEKRQIPFRRTLRAMLRVSRNAKARR